MELLYVMFVYGNFVYKVNMCVNSSEPSVIVAIGCGKCNVIDRRVNSSSDVGNGDSQGKI